MLDVAKLAVKVESKGIKSTTNDLEKLEKQGKKTEGATKSMAKQFLAVGSAVAGAAAVVKFGTDLVTVNAEFQKITASMKTVTGSSAAAEEALGWIEQFTTETPYQLTQVTGAFIKMKSLGLDASKEALRSYGNTASAMGKDLNQMIEAVADASTGQFERLREFGITSKSEGDQVSLTFQGVTKTIGKNSKEISEYLRSIGDVEFAGAMTDQMDTIGGAFSNLKDEYEKMLREIGDTGLNGAIQESILKISELIKDPNFRSGLTEFASNIAAMVPVLLQGAEAIMALFNAASSISSSIVSTGQSLTRPSAQIGLGGPGSTIQAASDSANPLNNMVKSLVFGSFASGTDYVPQTGLAMVHQGEKIVPAAANSTTSTSDGGITIGSVNITIPGMGSPREAAKMIEVELKRLGARQLAY